MGSFLELARVSVVRGERVVLDDVSLLIEGGEQIALLGPNGCGKSTLLKTITCELYPLARAETRVEVLGRERWDLTELKKQLGVVQAEIPGKPMLAISGFEAVVTGLFFELYALAASARDGRDAGPGGGCDGAGRGFGAAGKALQRDVRGAAEAGVDRAGAGGFGRVPAAR